MKNTSDPKPLFIVMVTHPEGFQSLLTHRNRAEWRKPTAQKHAREFAEKNPGCTTEIQEGNGPARL